MNSLSTQEPQVTIVVVPRERFSCTQQSLESIYKYTEVPFKLVYVDGNSPAKVKKYLQSQAENRGFKLVRTDYYLSPNHARNIGLSHVDTKYLVFFDNDVVVSPGWLKALLTCAEETGATVVGPLVCEKEPVHEIIHCAGGESHIVTDVKGRRHLREKMYKQGHRVADMLPKLQRTETELAEFHCVLVRKEIFERIGNLDPQMLCTKEHLDFCMTVREAGGKVYFEPNCVVTYVPGPPLELTDMHFYMLRWSDEWMETSLERLRQKWGLSEDGYFKTRYKKIGSRRKQTIIKPLVERIKKPFKKLGIKKKWLREQLLSFDKLLNCYLTSSYARKHFLNKNKNTLIELQSSTPQSN
ncbi:MAG: glycosyltransferase [Xenococcaceae cyanobacterium MO_167.B27]|nr:glycosyltransferase [Xenococcaceae cyanobacterium MO_167.B27]